MTSQWFWSFSNCVTSILIIGPVFFREGFCQDTLWYSNTRWCPTTIFNFGDSLSDTGNVNIIFPGISDPENLPYGEKFFGKPARRFSNGRLVIDFIALAFGLPLLDPHTLTVAHNYAHGANFAYGGATSSRDDFFVPFYLGVQVGQFLRFKSLTLASQQQSDALADFNRYLPAQSSFSSALYIIGIGGNDFLSSFFRLETTQQIIDEKVPLALQGIVDAIQILYKQEARNFLIYNIPPEGCATVFLTVFRDLELPKDELGCIVPVNLVNQAFNTALYKSIQALKSSLPGVTISHFDYYSANLEILKNPAAYGFNPTLTQTACCGAPGQGSFNYNLNISCGQPGASECANADEFVNWDGIHFTEAFYRVIAKFLLTGQYLDPPVNLTSTCNLTFKNFGQTTFSEVFPGGSLLS